MIIKLQVSNNNCTFEKVTQSQFTSSKSKMETAEQCVKCAQSLKVNNGKTKTVCEICSNLT